MTNPFAGRASSLQGPAADLRPVIPDDAVDLPSVAIALFVETGGAVAFTTASGNARIVNLPDFCLLPVGIRRVSATGTTASGIHAMVL
jgi:hypothetical protein